MKKHGRLMHTATWKQHFEKATYYDSITWLSEIGKNRVNKGSVADGERKSGEPSGAKTIWMIRCLK